MPTTTAPTKYQTELEKLRKELLRQILKNEARRRFGKSN
jgi:hypothetical protein